MLKSLINPLIMSILVGFTTILLRMITKGYEMYNYLIISVLNKLKPINKSRKFFLVEILILMLCIKGKINFLQLGRFGKFKEQRYRQQFEKKFDFLSFNKELSIKSGSGHYAIAFDPCYINKAGKNTPGLGWYWSGCAGQSKWGLEIGGLAAIDVDNHTAFHLEAVQTNIDCNSKITLTEWYADLISERKDALAGISKHLVADAWFSKKSFVDQVLAIGMHLICRLRDDADLLYLYTGKPTGKRGRPRKYAGKCNPKDIEPDYFEAVSQDEEKTINTAILYSKSLKRNIRVVHVSFTSAKGKAAHKLYYSTDLNMQAADILNYYQSRFQIEFLYRDGKQYTGLSDSQARSENKLHFHFNASLTSINIAKVVHWLNKPKEERKAFSMADIKTQNHNRLLLNRFFDVFGISPYSAKNQKHIKKLIDYGTIAA